MEAIDKNGSPERRINDRPPGEQIDWTQPGAPTVPAAAASPRVPLRAVASMCVKADGVSVFPTPAANDLAPGHYMLSALGAGLPQAAAPSEQRNAAKLAAVWANLEAMIEEHTGKPCEGEPLDALAEILSRQHSAPAGLQQLKALALAAGGREWVDNGTRIQERREPGEPPSSERLVWWYDFEGGVKPGHIAFVTAANPAAVSDLIARFERSEHEFKNFHRSLCARFGYTHDERDWKRDQVSLEEHIAGRIERLQEDLDLDREHLRQAIESIANLNAGIERAAAPATASGDERAMFEAWALSDDGGWLSGALTRNPEGSEFDYRDDDVQGEWRAWQARAAVSAATKPTALDLSKLERLDAVSTDEGDELGPVDKGRWVRFADVQSLLATKPAAAPADVEQLEQIAQSWDGCMVDAPGETMDVGATLRKQFKGMETAPLLQDKAAPAFTITGNVNEMGRLEDENDALGLVIQRESDFVTIKGLKISELQGLSRVAFGNVVVSISSADDDVREGA